MQRTPPQAHRAQIQAIVPVSASFVPFRCNPCLFPPNFAANAALFMAMFFASFWLSGYGCLIFGGLCALSLNNKSQIAMAVFYAFFSAAFYGLCTALLKLNPTFLWKAVAGRDGEDMFVSNSCYLCVFAIAVLVLLVSCEKLFSSGKKDKRQTMRKHNKQKHQKLTAVSLVTANLLILSAGTYS